jgi:oxygen-independent coproporphyrinogen-3 oxidase
MDSATSSWTKAVREGRFAIHRGHAFRGEDLLRARIIEALMCDFRVRTAELVTDFGLSRPMADALFAPVAEAFGDFVVHDAEGLSIPMPGRPLTRMIAARFDAYSMARTGHSSAI